MTDAPSSSVDTLFQKWKNFLDRGDLHTATWMAGGDPALSQALQQRINTYFSCSAAEFEETRTQESVTQTQPAIPPRIPGFTVLELLGRGGMGSVYHVRDTLNREWAMKVVRHDRLSDTAKARFFSEALAMAKLKHPHIVSVHSYHEPTSPDDVPYLLMPLYPASLHQKFHEYLQNPTQAVTLLVAIAEGVGCLHANGFIHRDIKPANILLDEHNEPVVSDFGLVKDVGQPANEFPHESPTPSTVDNLALDHPTLTVAGSIMGTGRYMSPEQAAGQSQLANPTWDVWALGVMAHELLVGQAPPSSNAPHELLAPTTPDNPPPSQLNPHLPAGLEPILQKCLARRIEDRYANAQELAHDLRRWLTASEISATPAERTRPPHRVRPWLWSVVATILVGGIALGVYYRQLSQPQAGPETPRQRLERQLNAGQPVTLIGDDGRPDYFRLLALREGANPIEDRHVFTLTTYETVFVELLPSNICPHGYELRGEFQFLNEHGPLSVAGFYFGHNPDIPADSQNHAAATWSYHENALKPTKKALGPNQRLGTCRLEMLHYFDPSIQRPSHGSLNGRMFTDFINDRPGQNQPSASHQLSMIVTPTTMSGSFDGQPVGERPLAEIARDWNISVGKQFPRPPFGPHGGAGLYVSMGTVAFNRVVVIPLPKP